MKKIAVYCSASSEIDGKYNKVAREFVRKASGRGFGIITGGTVKGTMGEVAEELHLCGGYHRGVIPRFMESLVYPDMTETVWTDTMSERKTLLREDTIGVVALPGGVGTLDEVVEVIALVHLKQYFGKVLLLDYDGFYQPLRLLLLHYVETGMLKQETFDLVRFASTPDELLEMLAA